MTYSIVFKNPHGDDIVAYEPQPRQLLLHTTAAHQILYGGAVGGGKSHSIRWDLIILCLAYPGLDAYLFRRTLGELEDNHIRKIQMEIPTGADGLGSYKDQKKRFEFNNGSGINFCYCEKEQDVTRYQGSEMHVLGVDEASHLTPFQLNYLRGRARLGSWMPKGYVGATDAKFRGPFPRILFGSNPGGPGHNYLKSIFIDPAPAETIFGDESMLGDDDEPWPTIFIPAKMRDNRFIPSGYSGQYKSLGPELYKALTEGDWDAVVGQALHNLSRERHMLRPFKPPREWTRFMAMDWGLAAPFSVGWYAVSDGRLLAGKEGWPDRWIPEGSVVRYAEYYGWNGQPNQGCRLTAQEVGREIIRQELARNDVMDYRVADSEMWAQRGGPSPYEWMVQADPRFGVMKKAQKDRKRNYSEILSRLAGNERYMDDGKVETDPMFFVTADCTHFWRTVPTLILDDIDPEKGPETRKQEDHCFDEVAYGLRSRPFITTEMDRWEAETREARRGEVGVPYASR